MSALNCGSIELEATRVRFYSKGDEAAFFDWLKNMSFIESIEGHGATLYIKVDILAVDEEGLRELIAIFHRYCIDMRQFVVFDTDRFSGWFRCPSSYWHKAVFDSAV